MKALLSSMPDIFPRSKTFHARYPIHDIASIRVGNCPEHT